jgi:PBP4 family serine-type D-alanyl-D-alanine carboxypeptidase
MKPSLKVIVLILLLSFQNLYGAEVWSNLPSQSKVFFAIGGAQSSVFEKGKISKPASLAKLFTAQMGLSLLGADYTPAINVSWNQGASESTAQDLTLSSNGAPEFDPAALIQFLKSRGVRTILGDIQIEPSRIQKPADMRASKDSGYCYNAKPAVLNFQQNCVSLHITSRGAQISDPDLNVNVRLDLQMGASYNGTRPHFVWLDSSKTEFEYVITTHLKNSGSVVDVDVVVPDTTEWMKNKIIRMASQQGIEWSPQRAASGRRVEAAIGGGDVGDVLCSALRDSSNLYADSIFGMIPQANRRSFLSQYAAALVDGSGFSASNKMSGEGLLSMLTQIQGTRAFSFYQHCLPSPGAGTLESRLGRWRGRLIAKTGSLSGLTNLAGYFKNSSGQWIPFVFLLENPSMKVADLRKVQDQILEQILAIY